MLQLYMPHRVKEVQIVVTILVLKQLLGRNSIYSSQTLSEEPAYYISVFQTKLWDGKKAISTRKVASLQDRYLTYVVGYFSKSVFCKLLMNHRFTESSRLTGA